jgi:hypothetical protein
MLQPGMASTVIGGPTTSADADDDAASSAVSSDQLFAPSSFWYSSVRTAPVAANSASMVSAIAATVASPLKTAALNTDAYSTTFYTAAADTPLTNVAWSNCQSNPWVSPGPISAQMASVPIPADAQPSAGTDAEMTIYSPSTDKLWEFWLTSKTAAGWSACWGGRIDNVSASPGYFPGGFGATASGLPVAGGMISLKDLASGSINHALSLELPMTAATTVSWPAQRTDGKHTGAGAVPMGTRFRLDPSLDLSSLGLSPIGLLVAKAAQTYGFVVTDTAANVALQGESGIPALQSAGTDPWSAPLAASKNLLLRNFPWSSLQALPNNYGE